MTIQLSEARQYLRFGSAAPGPHSRSETAAKATALFTAIHRTQPGRWTGLRGIRNSRRSGYPATSPGPNGRREADAIAHSALHEAAPDRHLAELRQYRNGQKNPMYFKIGKHQAAAANGLSGEVAQTHRFGPLAVSAGYRRERDGFRVARVLDWSVSLREPSHPAQARRLWSSCR